MLDCDAKEAIGKRRRVAAACQSCRDLKSKCDGRKPICGRCEGYGYSCNWPIASRRKQNTLAGLREGALVREALEARIGSKLPDQKYMAIEQALATLQELLPPSVLECLDLSQPNQLTVTAPKTESSTTSPVVPESRFLGAASDVRFFHQASEALGQEVGSDEDASNIQSYEQEAVWSDMDQDLIRPRLPPKSYADQYINTYFATIHNAYPFICKPQFLEEYRHLWIEGSQSGASSRAWLQLLYSIFAIGAYYHTFHGQGNDKSAWSHKSFHHLAMNLDNRHQPERSPSAIRALLARCFYLLATSQTDACWFTLGQAIRISQSIGLHVEGRGESGAPSSTLQQEMRRRAWYSIYVLDRLLALQLGRPITIHYNSYKVWLPSSWDDSFFDIEHDQIIARDGGDQTSLGNYFLSVIELSHIIGQVIDGIYSLRSIGSPQLRLETTQSLDAELLSWKENLLRDLRFDLGHAFEKNTSLRRQRNMLAIKFHHLRALLHRPYLGLGTSSLLEPVSEAHPAEHQLRSAQLRATCVSEAQATAQMLYNVPDQMSLVHDFPWWQMISCLLCASSILVIAQIQSEGNQAQLLHDDAETCLKAFSALGTKSDAAQNACRMIQSLQRKSLRPLPVTRSDPNLSRPPPRWSATDDSVTEDASCVDPDPVGFLAGAFAGSSYGDGMESWPAWPMEMTDPMMWLGQYADLLPYSGDVGHDDATTSV